MMQTTNTIKFPALNILLKTMDLITGAFGKNIPALVELKTIRKLPSGTLGRSLADFLDRNQLKPFNTGIRRKQLHDCIHVVTDYDSTPIGEAEVQAFLLGCKFTLFNYLIQARVKLKIKRVMGSNSCEYHRVEQRLKNAYSRGKKSLLDPDGWQPELLWDRELETVRKTFHL